jgi:hypothetical protein
MRTVPLVALVALVVACRGAGTSRPKASRGGGDDAGGVAAPDPSTPGPTAPAERCAGGEPWNGAPEGCAYEVEGCCYVDAETACAAAKCDASACEVLETHPAQIRCRAP